MFSGIGVLVWLLFVAVTLYALYSVVRAGVEAGIRRTLPDSQLPGRSAFPGGADEHFDIAAQARCSGKSCVRSQQHHVERFCQRDVRSVVDCQTVPQAPAPGEQRPVRRSTERQLDKI